MPGEEEHTQSITEHSLVEQMVGVQEVEEAEDDPEDAVSEPPLPECLAAISLLKRFSLSHGLLSNSIEKSLATLQKIIRHEMSKKLRQLTLHDVTRG